ncbi:hypothetical protein [Sinomonas mesophila]|uniref:hypothetical protein n=1 Tax=Sinomonas mesophila TaxID=1531955 RepID=UPI000986595B|nr:hypothetical protein [Sinomonas mesophila]
MTFPQLPNQSQTRIERPREPTQQELWLGPQPTERPSRRWLWIGLGAGAVAVGLVVAAAVVLATVVFSPDAAVRRASEQMSADLASGSTAAAYAQFTPALKQGLGEAELMSALTELKVDGSCRAEFTRAASVAKEGQRPRGEAEGHLVCGSRAFDVSYRWEGDPLLLDALKIQPR